MADHAPNQTLPCRATVFILLGVVTGPTVAESTGKRPGIHNALTTLLTSYKNPETKQFEKGLSVRTPHASTTEIGNIERHASHKEHNDCC